MIFTDLFTAIAFGMLIVFLLSRTFNTKGPWGSLLSFFIVVALFAWTAGVWFRPYSPVWMGVSWIPIVFVGFLVAMLLTAVSPKDRFNRFSKKKHSAVIEKGKADADVFFWILIFCLVLLAASHYFWFPQFGWY